MSIDRLERRMPEVLTELALPRTPDYVDDILGRTARTPQRPGWTFLERWFRVSTTTAMLPGLRLVSPRALIVLAILAALVVATLALFAGSQPKLPPLFGLARNGLVVTADGAGIYTIDPQTNTRSTLLSGTGLCCLDIAPDGQRFLYLTAPVDGADPTAMTVARLDGSVIRDVPAELLQGLSWSSWTPNDNSLLITNATGLVKLDLESGKVTRIDVGFKVLSVAPIGATGDLLLTSRDTESSPLHVYRLTPGSPAGPREIAVLDYVVDVPALSPDGSRFAYAIWGPEDRLHGRIHVVDLASGVDRALTPEDQASNADPHVVEGVVWSPDGTMIESSWFGSGFDQIVLLPVGGGAPRFVGPRLPENALQQGAVTQFAPDGTWLLVHYGHDDSTWLLPLDGSPGQLVPWTIGPEVGWQRLAR
jgi:hypothetical protein